ncbi:MAG: phage putative head morphosis protein family [Rhodocyclales bacterium]|nr:phage putative head morphosis protein family [Rhodocyclales bacterium]
MPDRQTPNLSYAIGLPPEKAIAYFESKGYAVGWDWHEVWQEAHAKAFTVAGVLKTDALKAIRDSLSQAMRDGTPMTTWRNDLVPQLEKLGLWGQHKIVNPDTGEIKTLSPHRLATIYRTNMQTAFSAGRYKTQLDDVTNRPYWQRVEVMDARTRPSHRVVNGMTFRADDPIWKWFYPPDAFGCRGRVRTFSDRDITNRKIPLSSSAGRVDQVQVPISTRNAAAGTATVSRLEYSPGKYYRPDAGWSYNPGAESLKPFTPPPLDTLPRTFPQGVSLPDLPRPTLASPARLLAPGLPPQDYAAAFLGEFGLKPGESKVFKDAAGGALAISDDLFKTGAGEWKADKDGRGPYMRLLADAVMEPDEIWLRWEQSRNTPGAWLLRRRYIKSWEIAGSNGAQYGLSVFEFGKDGWTGATAMMANSERGVDARRRYIEKQRDGFLLFRKY